MQTRRELPFAVRAAFLAAMTLLLSRGPTSAAGFTEGLSGYSVATWTEADGRPLGSVYGIVQANDGYLWVGSDAGLLRFDGWRFLPWNGSTNIRLPQTPATVLAPGAGGVLYVGFAGRSAVYALRDNVIRALGDDRAQLTDITSVAEDSHGTVWVVAGRALHRLKQQQWERVQVDVERVGAAYPSVVSVRRSRAGEIWVGTSDGLFSRVAGRDVFDRVTRQPRSRNGTGEWVWDIVEGPDGSLWTTDMATGFKVREPTATQWEHAEPRVMGYRLLHDQSRNVWIGTVGEGLWRISLDAADARNIERITVGKGLASNTVLSLLQDREQNVWIGTTAGLHRITRRKLTPISDVGLATSVDDVEGLGMVVGTPNGLVVLHQPGDRASRNTAASRLWVTRVHRDDDRGLWMATTSGTFYSKDDGRTFLEVLPDQVRTMASDRNGVVWLVSPEGVYNGKSGRVSRFSVPASWQVRQIAGVFGDSSGRLWITDGEGGAGIVEESGALRRFGAAQGWQGWVSTAIFEDRKHTVWIGTRSGLVRFENGRFDIVGPEDGLPSDRIGAIVDDDHGSLWLNIDIGLVRLKRDEFAAVLANRRYRPKYHIYDASDGLSGAAIVNLRAAGGSDGRLWFIRGGGLTTVDPLALDQQIAPQRGRPTRLDAIIADDQRLRPVDGVAVPAGTKTLQITYSALELTTPQRLRFRYRLDGFDSDWRNAETRRQAFYTNLPPRRYAFRVEAAIDGEDWVDSSVWQFTLEPKFWQTSWFYAALAAGLLLAVWTAWRIRLRVVHHEFALVLGERTRLSREIHDTLLQSLAGMTLQLDKVARLVRASPELAIDQLLQMRRYVEANIRDARTSIWNLRSPILESKDLAAALEDFAQSLMVEHATDLTITVTGERRRVDPRIESHLLRIGQEAIANAVHHGGAEHIELHVRFDRDHLGLHIVDDGRGFEVEQPAKQFGHFGLMSMNERAKELGGRVDVRSHPGDGTRVDVVVPLRVAHQERQSA